MDSTYFVSSGSHILFTVGAIAVLATWPHCRSRLPLVLSLVLSTIQAVIWLGFVLLRSMEQGDGQQFEVWYRITSVISLGTSIICPLLLLVFVVLMKAELKDLLLAADGPGSAGDASPTVREATSDAARDPRYATRFDARHDTRHDPRNDPGYHPRQDG